MLIKVLGGGVQWHSWISEGQMGEGDWYNYAFGTIG